MSFTNWLYDELVNDEVISPDEYDVDSLSQTVLLAETELTEAELEDYRGSFEDYCNAECVQPDWDLPE